VNWRRGSSIAYSFRPRRTTGTRTVSLLFSNYSIRNGFAAASPLSRKCSTT
jgi:hypothetical protein